MTPFITTVEEFNCAISKANEEGARKERERMKPKIRMLRQWINERSNEDILVTTEQIEKFLIN